MFSVRCSVFGVGVSDRVRVKVVSVSARVSASVPC